MDYKDKRLLVIGASIIIGLILSAVAILYYRDCYGGMYAEGYEAGYEAGINDICDLIKEAAIND